jgi:hypothetical protein
MSIRQNVSIRLEMNSKIKILVGAREYWTMENSKKKLQIPDRSKPHGFIRA